MKVPQVLWLATVTLLPAICVADATGQFDINSLIERLPFKTPLRWKSSDVLIRPISDETHTIVSVKDPTIVRYNGLWHVYATVYSTSARTWSMVYLNFKDWADAPKA
ncbi:MAG: non-reducing end alpha-L-arabinofuranosidase family hydrolase, partial [Sedimentisphaerales bacterium]|nr:non-reducing end alpha-L-arabinofuranosidase family hydrolase [Sedimentisphaerales bacterium]